MQKVELVEREREREEVEVERQWSKQAKRSYATKTPQQT